MSLFTFSAFCFIMSLSRDFQIHVHVLNFLVHSWHPLPLATEFIRSTLSFKDSVFCFEAILVILFQINKIYSVFYSQYPQAFKHNEYLLIDGIGKQSLSTCMHSGGL